MTCKYTPTQEGVKLIPRNIQPKNPRAKQLAGNYASHDVCHNSTYDDDNNNSKGTYLDAH